MRIAIVRRALNSSFSMDVYADGLVTGLRQVRPQWSVVEITPSFSEYQGSIVNRIGKYYQRYWSFSRQIQKRTDIDIYHIVDHSDGHLVYGLRKTGKPIIITCHDLINYIQPENLDNQSKLPLISKQIWNYAVQGICHADYIVTVSDHTAKDVRKIFSIAPIKLTTAYNGVDPVYRPLSQPQAASIRATYGIAHDTFCLLNVGSNHPRKNVFSILKALAELRQQTAPIHYPQVHFIKAGADFTNEQKIFITEQNLTDCVTYAGKPDKEALAWLYCVADALIAPSIYEGFGITLLEAMACGTPVITSNVTSLPEVVGEAGIMVAPEDTQAIVEAILKLINDVNYRDNLIKQGTQRVKTFTWQNAAETVAQVYEKAIAPEAYLPHHSQSA